MDGVLQWGHPQFFVQSPDAVSNEFTGIELDTVDRLLIDPAPERLELFFLEVGIQRIGLRLAVITHVGQLGLAEDAVDQAENLFRMRGSSAEAPPESRWLFAS